MCFFVVKYRKSIEIYLESVIIVNVLIITKILTEEGTYIIGRKGKGYQKISKKKYEQLCSWLKKQIDILNPSIQNQIFW